MAKERRGPSIVLILAGLIVLIGAVGSAIILSGEESLTNDDGEQVENSSTTTEQLVQPGSAEDAQQTVGAFVTALTAGDLGGVTYASSTTAVVIGDFDTISSGLAPFTLAATEGPVTVLSNGTAEAPIELTWTFPGEVAWTSTGLVTLEVEDSTWRVRWHPSILETSLGPGDRLSRDRLAPRRGEILGRDGSVLIGEVNLVHIGVRPSRVQDLPLLVSQLEALVGADPVDLTARIEAADPGAFVDVTTLDRPDYEAIREQIFPLPGTVFRESSVPTAADPTFARAVLGRSGEVTAEIIEQNPGLFQIGDFAGLSGLQAAYNAVLAGRPGVEISVLQQAPDPTSTTTGTGLTTTSAVHTPNQSEVLATIAAIPGETLITTIDPAMQRAAEAALDASPKASAMTSALVAIEVSTGEVVAVANGPRGATVNFAMTGQYPPGSIFKIVSGYTVLRDALGPADSVDCPASVTVGGRTFSNAENEVFGVIPFSFAFFHSCNTAFVNATLGFAPEALSLAAADFGLGVDAAVGTDAFLGSVPVADGSVEVAASSFGQGRLLLSPLSAAMMAATAADGTYRSPRLITSPTPGPQLTSDLAPGPAAVLRDLMRGVVTEGTGRAVAGVAGGPVSGKTGTAEFGNQVPPQSHAWFVGFQGNVAFAVFVEAGEFGGSTSAPISANFLNALAALDAAQDS